MLADHPAAIIRPAHPAAATGQRLHPVVAMATAMHPVAITGRQHRPAAAMATTMPRPAVAVATTMAHLAAAAIIRPVLRAAVIGPRAVLPADITTDLTPQQWSREGCHQRVAVMYKGMIAFFCRTVEASPSGLRALDLVTTLKPWSRGQELERTLKSRRRPMRRWLTNLLLTGLESRVFVHTWIKHTVQPCSHRVVLCYQYVIEDKR